MHIKLALDRIFRILDEDDPVKHANNLRLLLEGMRKGLNRSGVDDEVIDFVNEYIDSWTVEEAIEEDIDSFIEETNDVYDKVVGEDGADDDDEEDDDDDDDDDIDDDF